LRSAVAAFILLLVGVSVVITGVALVSVPAALIVGGSAAIAVALLADIETLGRSRK